MQSGAGRTSELDRELAGVAGAFELRRSRERLHEDGAFGVLGLHAHVFADGGGDGNLIDAVIDDDAFGNAGTEGEREDVVRGAGVEVVLAGDGGEGITVAAAVG